MPENAWVHYKDLPLDETFVYGDRYGVSGAFESEQMRFSIIRFAPGERGPRHYHNWEEEYYLVLEGVLDVEIGGESVVADVGVVLFTPPGTVHRPENNTDEPALLLSVTAPVDAPDRKEDRITLVEDSD